MGQMTRLNWILLGLALGAAELMLAHSPIAASMVVCNGLFGAVYPGGGGDNRRSTAILVSVVVAIATAVAVHLGVHFGIFPKP